ncbi:cysteine desulfurase [Maribellus sp. CM-23]|uniref:aminotransferase class V-fold PLP-dependent enzyme n=1 Tax=Maribellus sp. CM-23 TaxID=2781026 RepID=UPI001F3BF057|nr:cysteine desulfurase [Maribellus sp. CM-23]MCE4566220.1 cysteine desulfurase [Maribellus sp. CM-23]
MAYNIDEIRSFFPVLKKEVYNKPLIYFDSAASSQKPVQVLKKEEELHNDHYGNIHRGAHFMADKATQEFEDVREQVRAFINAASRKEIIFTKGTTESINLVASSFCERFVEAGDEIIVSEMEHHANIVPWQLAAIRKGAKIVKLPFNDLGVLEIEKLPALINEKTKLIAVAHVSNVLGTINPVKEMIELAHQSKVAVLVDGAQASPHIPIDVQELDADFYVFSAHKMYGPNGVGILYGKEKWLEEMPPYQGGGEMISEVSFEGTTFNELPYKFEAGTPHISGVIAFGAALALMNKIGLEDMAAWEHSLLVYATQKLKEIEGMKIYGEAPRKSGVISFNIEGIHSYDLGMLLDKMGIALRTGHLCADTVMAHYGIQGCVRISFGMYNTKDEIDAFIAALNKVRMMF